MPVEIKIKCIETNTWGIYHWRHSKTNVNLIIQKWVFDHVAKRIDIRSAM